MKSYWDHSEAERGQMTEEQIRAFEPFELMRAGAVRTVAPEPLKEQPPNTPMRKVYTVGHSHGSHLDVAFATAEEAQRFIESNPLELGTIWRGYTGSSQPTVKPLSDAVIGVKEVYDADAMAAMDAEWRRYAEAEKAYKTALDEHKKANEKESGVVHGMWEDWYKLVGERRELGRVVSTFAEYVALAGDQQTALKFLLKAFPRTQIEDAAEYLPNADLQEALSAEAQAA